MKKYLLYLIIASVCVVFGLQANAEEEPSNQEPHRKKMEELRNMDPEKRREMMQKMRDRRESFQGGPSRGGQRGGSEQDGQHRGGQKNDGKQHGKSQNMESRMFHHLLNSPEMAEKLGINDEQRQKITEQMKAISEETQALHEELKDAYRKQAEIMGAEEIDENALMRAVDESGALQTRMAKLRMKQLLVVKKSMTPEQMEKMRKFRQSMMERMQQRPQRGGDRSSDRPQSDRRRGQGNGHGTDRPAEGL